MPERRGEYTVSLSNRPTVLSYAAVGDKKEGQGPLGKQFDAIFEDTHLGEKTWEKVERALQKESLTCALDKAGLSPSQLQYLFAGDLLNQNIASTFGLREMNVPLIGQFGACSTMGQTMAMAAIFVDAALALDLDLLAEEYGKNVVCLPKIQSVIYDILAAICQKQKKRTTRNKFACIRTGIELLEQDSDRSIAEIAAACGVSECYFRCLFQEYSGESPMTFRQRHRIERAKQLLLSDEHYTVGEIAQELGFSDIYHFSKTFKNFCGVSPSNFIEKEQG